MFRLGLKSLVFVASLAVLLVFPLLLLEAPGLPARSASTQGDTAAGRYDPDGRVLEPSPTPGPTPTPSPTPILTPTPTVAPTPAAGARLELGTVTLAGRSSRGNVEVWARNIRSPAGLGTFELSVLFDPARIRINAVVGTPPFAVTSTALEPANANGRLTIAAFITVWPGPTGDVLLGTINVTALTPGIHSLALTTALLSDTQGLPIPGSAVHGSVTGLEKLKIRKSVRVGLDEDGVVVIFIGISDIINPATGEQVLLQKNIKQFRGELLVPSGSAAMLGGREGGDGFNVPVLSRPASGASSLPAAAVKAKPPLPGTTLARLVPRLTGARDAQVDITVKLPSLIAGDDEFEMEEDAPTTITFRRGAVRGRPHSDASDALFIAQHRVGMLDVSQLDPLNAASIHHDGSGGDRISMNDALFLIQQIVGLRDTSFVLLP